MTILTLWFIVEILLQLSQRIIADDLHSSQNTISEKLDIFVLLLFYINANTNILGVFLPVCFFSSISGSNCTKFGRTVSPVLDLSMEAGHEVIIIEKK